MNVKKVLFILAFLLVSDAVFIGCSKHPMAAGTNASQPVSEINTAVVMQPQISPYDAIMRRVAEEEELDWRWLAAIAYQESRFNPDIRSHAGAQGLMQIMGSVARQFGVAPEEVADPETNIRLAAKLIKRIESGLRFGPQTTDEDRMKIILACYNGGIGHIYDARRLAAKHGVNHNSWNSLREYVTLKGTDQWINDEAVRNGRFNGTETVDFVTKVMRQYSRYCAMHS